MRRKLARFALAAVVLFACSESQTPTGGSCPGLADVMAARGGWNTQSVHRGVQAECQRSGRRASGSSSVAGQGSVHLHPGHQGLRRRVVASRGAGASDRSHVARIEQDQRVSSWRPPRITPANWGLDRIDQRNLPLSHSYTYNRTGAGVHFYGIDTGINLTHTDLAGRVGNGFDAVTPGGNADRLHWSRHSYRDDCRGHYVRRRQGGDGPPGSGARLRRVGHHRRRYRRDRLGDNTITRARPWPT